MTGFDNPAATTASAVAIALVMQLAKNSQLIPWMNRQSGKLNVALSAGAAFLTSLAIHWTWDGAKDTLVITGLSGALTHGIWNWLTQFLANHAAYKTLVVPAETLGEIRAILQRSLPPPISEAEAKGKL